MSVIRDEPLAAVRTFQRGTDLQRNYRQLLDQALEAPVAILDSKDRRLAVAEWSRFAFAEGVVRVMDALAQFHAVHSKHRGEPASEWAAMTPFPFLRAFDVDEIEEFAAEQIPCLEECLRKRDLTEYYGNLRGWESSAETYDDQAMLDQMATESDAGPIELYPPPVAE